MSQVIIKHSKGLSNQRLQVKAFKTTDAMNKFLNKQTNNDWQEAGSSYPTKSGTYLKAGGAWHNIKGCDASMLAHC
jgi:hypothetical protein